MTDELKKRLDEIEAKIKDAKDSADSNDILIVILLLINIVVSC